MLSFCDTVFNVCSPHRYLKKYIAFASRLTWMQIFKSLPCNLIVRAIQNPNIISPSVNGE